MAAETKRERKAREAAEKLAKLTGLPPVTTSNLVKDGEVIMTDTKIPAAEPEQQQEQQQQETGAAADQQGTEDPKAEDQSDDSDEAEDEDDDDDVLPPGVTPKATFAAEIVYGIAREVLMAAVESGDLVTAGWKAKRAGKVKEGKAVYALYEALKATNETGAMVLLGGRNYLRETLAPVPKGTKKPAKGVWDMFYYGHDLEVGRTIRTKLLKAAEGPAKIIREMAEMMVLHKMAPDVPTATQMVIASRQAAGLEV